MKTSRVMEILSAEGYRPELVDDGDIVFKYEGNSCVVVLDENDELYFRVMLPNFWPIENEKEREQAIKTALDITKKIKVAKVLLVGDQMWCSVETFLPSEESIQPVLASILIVLTGAAESFAEEMRNKSTIENAG